MDIFGYQALSGGHPNVLGCSSKKKVPNTLIVTAQNMSKMAINALIEVH